MFERFIIRLAFILFGIIVFMAMNNTAKAYDDLYLDPFTTSNWNTSGGWQSCAGYSGGNEVTDFEINPDGGAMNEITIIQSN